MEDGVWRTIGGRRVFIKNGQSVSDAMKESGKFKKKNDETEKATSTKSKSQDKLNSEKQIEKEFPYNFSEEVENTAHLINTRGYDDIDDVIEDFTEEQGITRSEAKYALLKDEFKTRQELYMDAREDGSYSDSELNHMESMAKDSYFKLQEAQEELDTFNKENKRQREADFEKQVNEGYEKFHGKTDKEISDAKDKQRQEDLKDYFNIPEEERVKAYEEGKSWKELINEKESKGVRTLDGSLEKDNKGRIVSQEEYDAFRQAYRDGKISKEDYRNDNYDALKNLSGTKIDTTKLKGEYHTLPERTPEEKASDERYANAKAMYKLTGDEKYKKAYQDEIKASGERIRQQVEAKSNNDKYTDYYKKEHLGEPSNYQKGDKIEFDNGYYDTVKGSIVREATDDEKRYNINSNLKGYIVRDENGFEYVVADTRIKGQGSQTGDPNKVDVSYKRFLNDVVNNKNEGKNYVEWKASQREKAKSTNDTMNDAIRKKTAERKKINESNVRKTFDATKEYDFDNNVKNEIEWKNKNKTLLENGYKEETGVDPYKNGKEKTSFKDYQTWRYGIEADKESNESSWSREFRENKAKNEDERQKNLSDVLRKKAYQKYLREHPGSKITLDEFLKRK